MAREAIGEVVVNGVVQPIEMDAPLRENARVASSYVGQGRLEVRTGDQVAFIDLRVRGPVLSLIHTEVPAPLRGQGIAEALARAGLEYARTHRMTVKPFCPFVARFITRHPEFKDLVDPTFVT